MRDVNEVMLRGQEKIESTDFAPFKKGLNGWHAPVAVMLKVVQ